jgi:signal transduction histidine kinase
VETLLRQSRGTPNERDESLRSVLRETDRMSRLVADLLALARADAGQPLDCRRLTLDTLLLEVYQQEKALGQGVQLALGELEQVEIVGDRDRLKQLMLNLADNALRYTQPGGVVTLDLAQRAGSVVLRVRDTGPGIPPEHLPRIFERFYRADEPRSRNAGGTGLGLAICKWIAEAHCGRIEVVSQVGVGSVFTVILPLPVPPV